MDKVNWEEIHKELESQGKFDEYTTPYTYDDAIEVDKDYEYLPKNLWFKFWSKFFRWVMFLLGPLATYCAFKLKVYDRKKLKGIKKKQGFFTVMNHCSYLDSLILKQTIRSRKDYMTVAPHNCKKGIAGFILKCGGVIPIPEKPSAVRNMNNAIHTIIENKGSVQFYAERAMWMHYEKPRPFKRGAFSYASKEMAPIVPIYIRWTKSKGIRKLFGFKDDATVIVLDPVYPKEGLSIKENTLYLQKEVQREFIDEYRRYYNIQKEEKPCIYDIKEEYLDKLDEDTKIAISM